MKNNNKGYTLIEVLVVVVIIGILSVISISVFSNSKAKARDAKKLTDVRQAAQILALEASGDPYKLLGGCIADNASINGCTGSDNILQFQNFDSHYRITPALANVSTALIKFTLEVGVDNYPAGNYTINHLEEVVLVP